MTEILVVLIPAAIAAFLFCVIVLLRTGKARESDTIRGRVSELSKQSDRVYNLADEELSKPLYERLFLPMFASLRGFAAKLLPKRRSASTVNLPGNEKLQNMLVQAGIAMNLSDFVLVRFVIMLGCGAGFALAGLALHAAPARLALFGVFGIFVAYAVIRYVLTARITRRRRAIENQMPDVLDLLSVSVEAGLGFEQAVGHIVDNMEGPLVDELAVTYREMSMGRTRRDALYLLGERIDVEEVRSFTAALIQAGQLGIPIKNVLQAQASAIRQSRRTKVQERAAKVSTKILLPMLVFIFPVLFIVLMGPTVLNLMSSGIFK